MLEVSEYLTKSREERRSHLALSEPCSEIGGNSQEFRALLSYFVGVKIPQKREFYLCHACHNKHCSNVHHLYWGTPRDNNIDTMESGNWKSIATGMREKYGEEKFREMVTAAAKKGAASNKLKAQRKKDERS